MPQPAIRDRIAVSRDPILPPWQGESPDANPGFRIFQHKDEMRAGEIPTRFQPFRAKRC